MIENMAKDNDNSFFHIHNGPCMNNNAPINVKPVGGGDRAWGGDLIVFVVPGVGHLTDLVLLGEGIFDCRFERKRLRPNICYRFHASRMRARSGKSGKSWRPLTRVSVDFIVLSSNFVCFSVFLIN